MEAGWIGVLILAGVGIVVFGLYRFLTRAQPRPDAFIARYHYAHRGLHGGGIPENSKAAFEKAVTLGYAIELDVRLSADGQVMVFHDENLLRMTGVDRPVSDLTAKALAELRLDGTDAGIPSFREVLEIVGGQVPLLVELKNTWRAGELEEKTYALLKEYTGLVAVQSFSPFSVRWFRINAPHILRGQLSSRFLDMKGVLPAYQIFGMRNLLTNVIARPHFISYHWPALPLHIVTRLRKQGTPILGWTVCSADEQKAAEKYCDAVIFEQFLPPTRT